MTRIEMPDIPARQLIGWTLGVVAVALCFWLLLRFQNVLLLLITGIILSTAVQPVVARLAARGVPRTVGTLLFFTAVVALLALLIWFTLPVLAKQGAALGDSLAAGYRMLYEALGQIPNILVRRLTLVLPPDLALLGSDGGEVGAGASTLDLENTLVQGRRLVEGVLQVILIAALTFYWTLEGDQIKGAAYMLVPLSRRQEARALIGEMEAKISGYVLGQGLLSIIVGLMSFLAYTAIGLPHALLLGVLAGLFEAVPYLGPVLGAIPAIIVGLSVSPATALWVVLASVIIQQLENNLLVPRVMKQTIGARPLVTLLALLAFGSLFGVLGALIALPLAAVIQLLLDRYLLDRESLERPQVARDRVGVLRYEANQLVQDVRHQVRRKESASSAGNDALEDEIEAIALELESYLATQEIAP